MKLRVDVVDAFTNELFKGNSAAVVITDFWLEDEKMQCIASENNLSETAFVVKNEQGIYDIRWFSPLTEIDFCGHATLAASFILFSRNEDMQQIQFHAKAVGLLSVQKNTDNYIEMNFPSRPPEPVAAIPEQLIQGLSISPARVLKNEQAYFAVYENENDVVSIKQDPKCLKQLAPYDVVVTAPSEQHDFVSRYFWPANGGEEDPVTGSIHAGLAPYWAKRLNKNELMAFQASSRGGIIKCSVREDRILLSGQAVHYLEGHINI